MNCFKRSLGWGVLGVGMGLFVLGCGSGSNNDQGVTFTNLGFYASNDTGGTTGGGRVCDTSTTRTTSFVSLSDATNTEGRINGVFECIGFQNNMSTQFIRMTKVNLSYFIDGAAENPPSTVVALSRVLGPAASSDGTTGPDSTLPDGFGNAPNFHVSWIAVVPAEVRAWIALNRNLLPEPPFTMTVQAVGVGVTSSGDVLASNPAELFVEMSSDVAISPTDGGGGTFESTDTTTASG